jgi:hypothetical protein
MIMGIAGLLGGVFGRSRQVRFERDRRDLRKQIEAMEAAYGDLPMVRDRLASMRQMLTAMDAVGLPQRVAEDLLRHAEVVEQRDYLGELRGLSPL